MILLSTNKVMAVHQASTSFLRGKWNRNVESTVGLPFVGIKRNTARASPMKIVPDPLTSELQRKHDDGQKCS